MNEIHDTIYRELVSDDSEVRAEYLALFEKAAREFSTSMAEAVIAWQRLNQEGTGDVSRAYVVGLVHAAIALHIVSLKLFLSGHIVAAGNLFRQVLEAIALALLCSCKELRVLKHFMEDRYASTNAVRDVLRHWKKLGLIQDSLQQLKESQEFYHKYSHLTRLTLANLISLSEPNAYVGAAFDDKKIDAYAKEVHSRVGLAKVFANFVAAVSVNVSKW